ncbi:MAG: hypothetical protein GXP49_00835 [Deltaproteobacteria bacterium]|nr:hypothetical protein [Deltaproteobacteria bacterium]
MAFNDYLKQIYEKVDGSVACGVAGFDGLTVESYPKGQKGPNMESVTAELSMKIKELFGSFSGAGLGRPEELMLKSKESTILVRTLTNEYFLMLILDSQKAIGMGRYYLRVIGPLLLNEL